MTRLENQIAEMENKVANYKKFAADKLAIFENQLPILKKLLASYKIDILDTDNMLIENRLGSDRLILRIWINTSKIQLSDRRIENLESKLRNIVPMPICPINSQSINIVYHD